jgi:hypothetical protein
LEIFSGFNLTNVRLEKLNNITCVDTTCSGDFCDRLFPKASPCGCYQTGARGYPVNHVFQMDFVFDIEGSTGEPKVITCTSLRFTELLFREALPSNMGRENYIIPKMAELRTAFRTLVTYVNGHGGWTISGWFRSSTTSETGTNEQVFSHTIGLHISYIQPANPNIFQDQGFLALRKNPRTFLLDGGADAVNDNANVAILPDGGV